MNTKNTVSDTLANSVADQILADLRASGLHEGELFLTGDQVSKRYAVSRSIAREAVSRVQALGVLEGRQRKGLILSRPDPVAITRQWLPFYCPASDLENLLTLAQFRYALEIGTIDLAVAHATEDQLESLAQSAAAFETIARIHGHTREADEADAAFHKVILEMTGNALIAGMHHVLSDYFHASTQLPLLRDGTKAIREHQIIVEAFRRRDGETVRAILRAHLAGTVRARHCAEQP